VIKLLVVDDSPLMRRLLTDIFTAAGDFIVDVARDGAEAVQKLATFAPDVITMDIHMPGMDGLTCLDRIMVLHPTPVVMLSAFTAEGANETLDAIALGAVDFVAKPKGAVSLEIDGLVPILLEKVRSAATIRMSRAARLRDRIRDAGVMNQSAIQPRSGQVAISRSAPSDRKFDQSETGLVLVGCSTGGPAALDALLGNLPGDFPWPIVVAQHMPATFTGALARRLDKMCALTISEVDRAVQLEPRQVYIGRGDADLLLSRRRGAVVAVAAPSSQDHYWHPSVERLVESAMRVVPPERLIGVLMTGMGADGATAMAEMKQKGGRTIAESSESAVVWGMPGALVEKGGATIVSHLDRIATDLLALVAR